jgi:acyl transferase domain-containing protein
MKSSTIAIVGMAGRFPGARNLTEFWRNLHDGVEAVRDRTDAELLAAGATREELANPDYVKRASILDDVPMFDAAFFGFSPRDAAIMDPQHRHFLECAWEALETAGHAPASFNGSIGVFAGSGMNTYLIHNLLANRKLLETAGLFQLKQTGNDKDVLATRVSYQFDLRGPSINVQTACSTSLVAVHLACQSLLNFECDMALAGGVTIEIPHGQGYVYREGEILSRDGHCRSFDASSSGTVFASGVGLVVLRRLEDALEDHDHIHAVILGSAINNDGARKVGYLAPSVEGQAEVIAEAQDFAGVTADEISYVETHGTGTVVGDPIEVRALTQAFRRTATRTGYCGIGSLKSCVGHMDAAAGVAGLIKTVLSLEHAQIPPTLNFEKLNPHIELANGPFYINNELWEWTSNGAPRRAGVTSLGIGGTNAHVILEEAPQRQLARVERPYQLLTVSAKTDAAADAAMDNLAAYLRENASVHLADAAFTCQLGRQGFAQRRALVAEDTQAGVAAIDAKKAVAGTAAKSAPGVAFLFSGQGSQYVNMGRELYENEPVFRDTIDACAQHLREPLGIDLVRALYPPEEEKDAAAEKLNQTWLTQPALFAVEYALAQWWISLGVNPSAMVGHSIGEYVAACLAGVFTLKDALEIVAFRGRLIYELPSGSMLAVPLAAAEIELPAGLSLAAANNPRMSVVSGPHEEIAAFEAKLAAQSIAGRKLMTSHAFHSSMMEPILGRFEERLRGVKFEAPRIPYLSNVSGAWIKPEEAMDPAYWARHIRSTVHFTQNLAELLQKPEMVLLEAGPGNVLTSLARMQGGAEAHAYQSLPHPRESVPALKCALTTLGQLWTLGVDVDFAGRFQPGSVERIPLPTYPFEHQKFWIEPDRVKTVALASETGRADGELLFYQRVWKPAALAAAASEPCLWLVFRDELGIADRTCELLRAAKNDVVVVEAGSAFRQLGKGRYALRTGERADYEALLDEVTKNGAVHSKVLRKVLHLWSLDDAERPLDETLARSFYSPLCLAQAIAARDLTGIDVAFVSNDLQQTAEEPVRNPARAVLLGPARVLPKEQPGVASRAIDLQWETGKARELAELLMREMSTEGVSCTVAYRRGERLEERLESYALGEARQHVRLERGGVYLLTGGLGSLALEVAEQLARTHKARLVLAGRTAPPPETEWEKFASDVEQPEAAKQRVRKLLQIRALAGGLLCVQADVTSTEQMRAAVAEAKKVFGKLDGVFHTAGVLDDGPLALKKPEAAARVLAPKVQGTLVLEQALGDTQLACFVVFSSISSLLPPAGQVDYAAANAFLDAFAQSRNGAVTAVNWGSWRAVGMAARTFSPHPWLEEKLLDTHDEAVFAGQFSQQNRWVLAEHRFTNGIALIPGTGYLEMAASAFTRGSLEGAIEIRNAYFLAPFMVDANESKELRVQLERETDADARNVFRFSVFGKSDEWVEHCTGEIAACTARPSVRVDRAAIAARCRLRTVVFDDEHRTRQERQFNFGPRWRTLRRLLLGKGEGLAEIELDAHLSGDVKVLRQHPALLDMATGAALYLTKDYDQSDDLFLPINYRRMRVYRAFPAKLFSHIRTRQEGAERGEVETFDITIFDEQNQVIAEIEGFAMRRIHDAARAMEKGGMARSDPRASGERPIETGARPGIAPQAGVDALLRILQAQTPTAVIVLPEPLAGIDASEARPANDAAETAAQSATAPIAEGIEATLMAWWQELLGVDRVGLDDDFFTLGGHSLVGVRLFAKIKKIYQADLELAALFEARTVRQLAELIRRKQQPAAASEPKTWSALVAVQPNGSKPPLFCVHAVGGDVIFYEQLARALGPDQPLYAFQSPLVAQPDRRDLTIEAMAALYIKEMRAFYPQGPYLLGGASYGGFVLYEMARQLQQQGITPALVAMFDVVVPGSAELLPSGEKYGRFLHNIRSEGLRYLRRKVREKSEYFRDRFLEGVAYPVGVALYTKTGRHLPAALRFHYIAQGHWAAMSRYSMEPFPGKITLVRAIDRGPEVLGKREDPTLGWGRLALGGLDVIDVPTRHMYMLFDPYVASFAETLKSLLARAAESR